jgi:hypothetical protein
MQDSADAKTAALMLWRTRSSPYTAPHASKENNMRREVSRREASARVAALGAAVLLCAALGGCHKAQLPASPADVAAAQAEAQKEIDQAHAEARKDVKSAAKLAGSDSRDVALARVTGSFDIAMANADGAHKVAVERCLTLPPAEQQACKDRADADYQTAAANAKATRLAQLHKSS